MRIHNKYLRNRHFRIKHWKRIYKISHPYVNTQGVWYWTSEEQIKSNFDNIAKKANFIENGSHKHWNHAPKSFRKILNNSRKAKERQVMVKIRNGDYDSEFPKFKRDADWLYF